MPRTGRGGARAGKPGASYPNRSDLNAQPVRTGPSRSYGDAAGLAEAQQAVPLPAQPPPSLGAPTAMPADPVTAGMARGMGAGPSGVPEAAADPVTILRAIYARHPNEGLRRYLWELGVE